MSVRKKKRLATTMCCFSYEGSSVVVGLVVITIVVTTARPIIHNSLSQRSAATKYRGLLSNKSLTTIENFKDLIYAQFTLLLAAVDAT